MTDRIGLNLFLAFILVTGLAAVFSETVDHYLTVGVLLVVGILLTATGVRFAFHELAWWVECREMDRHARSRAALHQMTHNVEKVSLVKATDAG